MLFRQIDRKGTVVRVTTLVFSEDVEACLQRSQWIPGLSQWRPFGCMCEGLMIYIFTFVAVNVKNALSDIGSLVSYIASINVSMNVTKWQVICNSCLTQLSKKMLCSVNTTVHVLKYMLNFITSCSLCTVAYLEHDTLSCRISCFSV